MKKVPRTPFSTGLTQSARETERRIRNIFSGPKEDPPRLLVAAAALMVLLCGNLVSCQPRPAVPAVVMETQYYDYYSNYVEIPALALPAGERNEAVESINRELARLGEEYANAPNSVKGGNWCLLYPSETDRYISLTFFLNDNSYGHDGYVRSWVYDKEKGTQVTEEDAFALAGTTREALCGDLEALIAADPEDPRRMLDPVGIVGFRIKADGQPVFYLEAYTDFRDMGAAGFYDEWLRLYSWDGGEYSRYSCMVFGDVEQYPLVPAEEVLALDPPLWNQWYFSGGEPQGGFQPGPIAAESRMDMQSVLEGGLSFTEVYSGAGYFISQLNQVLFGDGSMEVRPTEFAVLDLDGDGVDEVVVCVSQRVHSEPVLVLRWQKGHVYGYVQWGRTFGELKSDGTFTWSSSAAEGGIARVRFEPQAEGPFAWVTEELAGSRPADSGEGEIYTLNGAPASAAEIQAAYDRQREKADAPWVAYTPENIDSLRS